MIALRTRRRCRGAVLPLALGVGVVLLLAAGGVLAAGIAQVAAARAQTAADLAAVSGARAARAADPGLDRRELVGAVVDAARGAAAGSGAQVRRVRLGRAPAAPSVEVAVAIPGPLGTTAVARARAGLPGAPTAAAGTDGRRAWATGGGYAGPLVFRDGKPICPAVAAAFDRMDATARSVGIDLVVTSGFRSDAEQAVLFRRHPDPRWVARPGQSRHRDATELDISTSGGAGEWLRLNGPSFGFVQRYSWEPWHWGHLSGCASAGGSGGSAPASLPPWVPVPYRGLVADTARRERLSPSLLAAVLRVESGFDPRAVSPVGARGIAQLMPATARGLGVGDPFDPSQAVPAAGRLLAGHLKAFGSASLALAAYNAGPGAVRRYGGVPPYAETRAYVGRVLALAGDLGALGADVVLLPIAGPLA